VQTLDRWDGRGDWRELRKCVPALTQKTTVTLLLPISRGGAIVQNKIVAENEGREKDHNHLGNANDARGIAYRLVVLLVSSPDADAQGQVIVF